MNNIELLTELIKCINDKKYFISKYIKIKKPKKSMKLS
jgi:hypothetical protein